MKHSTFLNDAVTINATLVDSDGFLEPVSMLADFTFHFVKDPLDMEGYLSNALGQVLEAFKNKIWVIPGHSKVNQYICKPDEAGTIIKTPQIEIDGIPSSQIVYFTSPWVGNDILEAAQNEIGEFIGDFFGVTEASVKLKFNNSHLHDHGSMRVNCVRLSPRVGVFGHSGSVRWTHSSHFKSNCFSCQEGLRGVMTAAALMDNSILVHKAYLVPDEEDSMTVEIQGFQVRIHKTDGRNIILLDHEPTVEVMASHIINAFDEAFQLAHVDELEINASPNFGTKFYLNY